ncbi:HlyC/CorC family transporter [Methanoplanus sp. FWC-SCC4]|uniref:HlyC/CorC family transporter n=1 Tax=Methanochimaera problematica TaxID=2609417 RepID=A0AA97I4K2_9EURY|nr:hemolysin family protein [Methanoplanus sp. FWC-SCC4]WOF16441.1 HlyC/CorC family transporter [Methanoplanus sp. FWC-SCC4]
MSYLIEIGIIAILIGLNALFALSEFAIVSSRKTRLLQRSEEGDSGALIALGLSENPTPFLSTIQIGITLVGVFAGAFGGLTLARNLSSFFTGYPFLAPYSEIMSVTLVVLVITYLNLVFGELVPKRIALGNPEDIASGVAKPMMFLSKAAAPLVFILTYSTEAVVKLLRVRESTGPPVTEDEVRIMLEEGTKAGVFERAELKMVEGVFDLGDRRVESLMTRRHNIVALDLEDTNEENLIKMKMTAHCNFPAYEDDLDNIVGMVSVKNVLSGMLETGKPDIRSAVTKPLFVPETLRVPKLIESFKESGLHIALVNDEYGSIQGIVTLHDILEAIVGHFRESGEVVNMPVVLREDGSWLIDGMAHIVTVKKMLSLNAVLTGEGEGNYDTIAGMVMYILQRIPVEGDHFDEGGFRFEVVDMDGNRVDKVLAAEIPEIKEGSEESSDMGN